EPLLDFEPAPEKLLFAADEHARFSADMALRKIHARARVLQLLQAQTEDSHDLAVVQILVDRRPRWRLIRRAVCRDHLRDVDDRSRRLIRRPLDRSRVYPQPRETFWQRRWRVHELEDLAGLPTIRNRSNDFKKLCRWCHFQISSHSKKPDAMI